MVQRMASQRSKKVHVAYRASALFYKLWSNRVRYIYLNLLFSLQALVVGVRKRSMTIAKWATKSSQTR
jgi:hypothetical protein